VAEAEENTIAQQGPITPHHEEDHRMRRLEQRKTLYGSDHWTDREDSLLDPLRDAAKIRASLSIPMGAPRSRQLILKACEDAARAAGFVRTRWERR